MLNMAVRSEDLHIRLYPDPILRAKARLISGITDEVRAVAQRMLVLMHEAPGVGLAAPQVGLNWRLFVANTSGDPTGDKIFVNPVIKQLNGEKTDLEEGCLSMPQVTAAIPRAARVSIEALDLEGQSVKLIGEGLDARVWQHETDHLDGILIIDRMSPLDRAACRQTLTDLENQYRKAQATATQKP